MRTLTLALFTALATCGLAFPTHAQPGGSSATRALQGSGQEAPKALWDLTPKEAFLEAAKQNKLSVLIFLNPGEAGSDQMLKDTLKDEAVLKWLAENSIAITEIAGSDSGWIKRKGIRKFPTVSIRTSNRRIIDIIHGQHSTEEWLTLFDTAKRSSNATTRPEGKAAEDPYSWLAYGSYLFGASGDPNEIGNAFLWCLDNTVKKDTEFYEKHLDFILRKLVQVAKLAPNVKQGIYTRRDALHRNVVAGEATYFEAYALSRFGIFLRDMDDPMRAFNQLKADTKHKDTLKTILLWNNLERMVAYRRYDDILRHLPDPKSAIEARMAAIVIKEKGLETELQSELPRPPGATKPAPAEADSEIPKIQPERQLPGVKQARIPMVLDSALLYECLLATGKEDKAHELMVMVTDFEPTGNTYAMFIERTNRLGKFKIRTALAERGSERVPEDEIWRITNMVIRGTRGGK